MGRGTGKSIGVDVSKHWLDGHLLASGRRLRMSNDPAGAAELTHMLNGGTGCPGVMGASGGYQQVTPHALVAKGGLAATVHPKRAHGFVQSRGITGKTGRIGAEVIAGFGRSRMPIPTPAPDPAGTGLAEILACRRPFPARADVLNQQLEHLQSPTSRARAHQVIAFLRTKPMGQDKRCLRPVEADAALVAGYRLLPTMPCCDKILVEMPEPGRIDRRPLAGPAGRGRCVVRDMGGSARPLEQDPCRMGEPRLLSLSCKRPEPDQRSRASTRPSADGSMVDPQPGSLAQAALRFRQTNPVPWNDATGFEPISGRGLSA